MIDWDKYLQLLPWHHSIEYFDYNITVDWAMHLLNKGIETEHILILASFSKPVISSEIRQYVSYALQELDIEEKYGSYSIQANIHYHIEMILQNYEAS